MSKKIFLDAANALTLVQSNLALIRAFAPAAGAIPQAQLGISAAQALIPIIGQLTEEVITPDEQTALMNEVNAIVSGQAFTGSEWQPSGLNTAGGEPVKQPVTTGEEPAAPIETAPADTAAAPEATSGQEPASP